MHLVRLRVHTKNKYAKLWGYMEEVRRTNHGSTIFMKLVDDSLEKGEPRF